MTKPSPLSSEVLCARRAQRVLQRDQLLAQANAAAGAIAELDELIAQLSKGPEAAPAGEAPEDTHSAMHAP